MSSHTRPPSSRVANAARRRAGRRSREDEAAANTSCAGYRTAASVPANASCRRCTMFEECQRARPQRTAPSTTNVAAGTASGPTKVTRPYPPAITATAPRDRQPGCRRYASAVQQPARLESGKRSEQGDTRADPGVAEQEDDDDDRHEHGRADQALAHGVRLSGRSGVVRRANSAQGGVEGGRREVGPQHVGEVELGVRRLPDQEVADALLATGADEQVEIGQVGRVQARPNGLLVDRRPGARPSRQRRRTRVDDLRAAGVVEGDVERHACATGRHGDGLRNGRRACCSGNSSRRPRMRTRTPWRTRSGTLAPDGRLHEREERLHLFIARAPSSRG